MILACIVLAASITLLAIASKTLQIFNRRPAAVIRANLADALDQLDDRKEASETEKRMAMLFRSTAFSGKFMWFALAVLVWSSLTGRKMEPRQETKDHMSDELVYQIVHLHRLSVAFEAPIASTLFSALVHLRSREEDRAYGRFAGARLAS